MPKVKKKSKVSATSIVKLVLLFSLASFLLATLAIALIQLLPWSAPLAVLEIPLNYLPKWLPFLLLVPLLGFWRQALQLPKLQLAMLSVGIVYIIFPHMGFSLPVTSVAREAGPSSLRILSANLAGVDALKFSALLRYQQPDVIVTQEIMQPKLAALLVELTKPETDQSENADLSISKTDTANGNASPWRLHCDDNLCLASRFPFSFVEAQSRRFRGAWGLMGASYDLDVNGEPLRIFNVHLETVRKGFEDISLTQFDLDSILENANNRKIEAELLASWVGEQRPVVVVGDFNMTTGESLYREYFGGFRNAFSEVGFGLGHTKMTRLLGVRIDHLLSTADVQPTAAYVGVDLGGDHRPLLVDLALGR